MTTTIFLSADYPGYTMNQYGVVHDEHSHRCGPGSTQLVVAEAMAAGWRLERSVDRDVGRGHWRRVGGEG